jgi:hypothetical protein
MRHAVYPSLAVGSVSSSFFLGAAAARTASGSIMTIPPTARQSARRSSRYRPSCPRWTTSSPAGPVRVIRSEPSSWLRHGALRGHAAIRRRNENEAEAGGRFRDSSRNAGKVCKRLGAERAEPCLRPRLPCRSPRRHETAKSRPGPASPPLDVRSALQKRAIFSPLQHRLSCGREVRRYVNAGGRQVSEEQPAYSIAYQKVDCLCTHLVACGRVL